MSQLKSQVDMLLTDTSSAYIPEGHISEMVLPQIKVAQKTGLLAKYGNAHLRIENSIIGGEGKYRRVKPILRSTTTYNVEGHGLEGLVTRDDYRNVLKPFDAERDETMGVSSILWLEKEKVLADALGDTAILTQNTTLSGTSQFNDYTNSDPLSVFKTARGAVKSGCGFAPDTAVMSWEVWNTLIYHPKLIDLYRYVQGGKLDDQALTDTLGVKRLLIGKVTYNSAKEGQSDSLGPVWGKNIVFGVMPERAEPYQTSLGYMVQMNDGSPRKVYKEATFNPAGATKILVEDEYQFLLSNVLAGYLVKNAIA